MTADVSWVIYKGGIIVNKALRKAAGVLCMVILTLSVSVPAYAVEPDKAKDTAETSSSSASETETEATTEEQTYNGFRKACHREKGGQSKDRKST